MRISGINYESFADGIGVRTSIFVSGCTQNCKGCQNKESQNFNYGKEFTKDLYNEIVSQINKRPYVTGITITGGDPFDKKNIDEVSKLIHDLKCDFPNKNIWVYTGRLYEDISNNQPYALINIDVLVDGRFEIDKRDVTLSFRGSSNQRIINVKETLEKGEIVLYGK